MKLPALPCEMTTSGRGVSPRGQSLTPGNVMVLRWISPGGSAQGDQIAPLSAGPSTLAGTSINRNPAARAGAAAEQTASVTAITTARHEHHHAVPRAISRVRITPL